MIIRRQRRFVNHRGLILPLHRQIKENPHLSTILGYAWPPGPQVTYEREQIETPDGDFFHVDWVGKNETGPILLVLHGLEGSSEAPYMKRLAAAAGAHGYRFAGFQHRSCSGEDNRQVHCYHSGFTHDIQHMLHLLQEREPETPVFVIGFSLGGSILANHLGRHKTTPNVKAACLCATPFNLAPGAKALQTGLTQVYELRFLLSLRRKAKAKARKHPQGQKWIRQTLTARTLEEFDHYWTAPSFGFQSSADYYEKASSAPHVGNISVPTYVLHAQNDPIVVHDCFPRQQLEQNPNLIVDILPFGGHMGFWEKEPNWLSERMLQFMNTKKNGPQ